MKGYSKYNLNLPVELHALPKIYCSLYFTIAYSIIRTYSNAIKNRIQYSLLKFYCISIVSFIVIRCIPITIGILSHFRSNKLVKIYYSYYLIMGDFLNSLQFSTFKKPGNADLIYNPLLIHYKFHYYSLLFLDRFCMVFFPNTHPPPYTFKQPRH
jgi:hypothetical protein